MDMRYHFRKPLFYLVLLLQLKVFFVHPALFALTFQSIEHIPQSTEETSSEQIQSDCQCDHTSIAKLLIYGTQDQYNFALSQLQNKDFSCLRSTMKSAAKEIEALHQNPNYNCEQTPNKNTLPCRKAAKKDILEAISKMLLKRKVLEKTPVLYYTKRFMRWLLLKMNRLSRY